MFIKRRVIPLNCQYFMHEDDLYVFLEWYNEYKLFKRTKRFMPAKYTKSCEVFSVIKFDKGLKLIKECGHLLRTDGEDVTKDALQIRRSYSLVKDRLCIKTFDIALKEWLYKNCGVRSELLHVILCDADQINQDVYGRGDSGSNLFQKKVFDHLYKYGDSYTRPIDLDLGGSVLFKMDFLVFKNILNEDIIPSVFGAMALTDNFHLSVKHNIPVVIRKVIIGKKIVIHGILLFPNGERKQTILAVWEYHNYPALKSRIMTSIYAKFDVVRWPDGN